MQESISVAKKLGVNLPDSALDDVMNLTLNTAPDSKSSLLVDVENNRRTEIETLNGALVGLAKENNVEAPINRLIYAGIKLLQ